MPDSNQELDARGLNCPLPILRAKKALNGMAAGEVLKIMSTDPGSVKDFQAFATQTGNQLLDSSEVNSEFHFFLKKGD
jgi:tRNA 2-thiouridine synthesizing protein A